MDIVVGYPPIYKEIAAKFLLGPGTIFTWGSIIYNPSGKHVTKDLIAHEEVHMVQQDNMPEAWWRKYLIEPEFRLSQEAEAYGRQYQYICSQNHNRNFQFQVLQGLSLFLSGPMYGFVCSQTTAMELIRGYDELHI